MKTVYNILIGAIVLNFLGVTQISGLLIFQGFVLAGLIDILSGGLARGILAVYNKSK